ncbi:uncharacterized protein DS421_19g662780 [Arachis hypogaea]|uniref:Uncharacterized protein n=1 Tax=Arachis hypogaea TaxID=3818 RepID=A0A6B9VBQ4_ARAHY|nr:uncharacterized protein DS421_19g662780 [Arachis hypogaea]
MPLGILVCCISKFAIGLKSDFVIVTLPSKDKNCIFHPFSLFCTLSRTFLNLSLSFLWLVNIAPRYLLMLVFSSYLFNPIIWFLSSLFTLLEKITKVLASLIFNPDTSQNVFMQLFTSFIWLSDTSANISKSSANKRCHIFGPSLPTHIGLHISFSTFSSMR